MGTDSDSRIRFHRRTGLLTTRYALCKHTVFTIPKIVYSVCNCGSVSGSEECDFSHVISHKLYHCYLCVVYNRCTAVLLTFENNCVFINTDSGVHVVIQYAFIIQPCTTMIYNISTRIFRILSITRFGLRSTQRHTYEPSSVWHRIVLHCKRGREG